MQLPLGSRPPVSQRRPAHVLFFAAIPPQPVRERIAAAWSRSQVEAPLRANLLHLTIQSLIGVDEVSEDLVAVLRRVGERVRAGAFELRFDRVQTFGGNGERRPIVVATDGRGGGANDLAIALRRQLAAERWPAADRRKVTPHVTMSYAAPFAETRHLVQPFVWPVEAFSLIDSEQGRGRHNILGTWPLSPPESGQGELF